MPKQINPGNHIMDVINNIPDATKHQYPNLYGMIRTPGFNSTQNPNPINAIIANINVYQKLITIYHLDVVGRGGWGIPGLAIFL